MQRRQFLGHSIPVLAGLSLPLLTRQAFAASLPAELTELSALDLSRAIGERQASCREVMRAYLERIARYNPVYNAIVGMPDEDSLLQQAGRADEELARGNRRSWLHGVPHAVKDLSPVAGLRYTSGSPLYATRVAGEDNELAARLRTAGAIFIGKTNSPEFGLGSQTYNPIYGATGSAWNPELTAGGSSGGAGSGLGTRMLPVADGSDMMGSLRNPAAFNNVIGYRPSTNVMREGDADDRALSTSGPMGRNTADTIALLQTIARTAPEGPFDALPLEGLRLGWLGDLDGYLAMEDGVLSLCESALGSLGDARSSIEAASLPQDPADLWLSWTTLRHAGRLSFLDEYEDPARRDLLKPELQWEIQQALSLTDSDTREAERIRRDWYASLDSLFERYDFLVLPTAQVFPFSRDIPWPREIAGQPMDTYHRWMEVVVPGSLGALPIINVPVGFDDRGRPMGMQVMGRFGDDRRVLQFGLAYEAITDFLQRRPPLTAAA